MGSVPRLRGAHRATERQGRRLAYCKRCHPGAIARDERGDGFAKRCAHGERAPALRRPGMTGRARAHAGAAAKRARLQAGNRPHRPPSPICTGPRRRPAPTPSTAPERPRAVAVKRTGLRIASVNGAPTISANGATSGPGAGPGERSATREERQRGLQVDTDRAAGKRLGDSRNLGKAGPLGGPAGRPRPRRRCDAQVWRNRGRLEAPRARFDPPWVERKPGEPHLVARGLLLRLRTSGKSECD